MKNIYEILKSFGLEIPEDKKADFDKAVAENYKTVKEVEGINGKLSKAEGERDALQVKYDTDIKQRDTDLETLKQKLTEAGTNAETLKTLQSEFDTLKATYANAQEDYKKTLEKQAYEFAIKEKTNTLQFTSNSAKKAFLNDALSKNLTMDNGNVLGFEDFVNAYKEQDAGAFVVETQKDNKPTPQFVSKSNKPEDNNSNNNGEQSKEKPLIW